MAVLVPTFLNELFQRNRKRACKQMSQALLSKYGAVFIWITSSAYLRWTAVTIMCTVFQEKTLITMPIIRHKSETRRKYPSLFQWTCLGYITLPQPYFALCWLDESRKLITTELANKRRFFWTAISDLKVVISIPWSTIFFKQMKLQKCQQQISSIGLWNGVNTVFIKRVLFWVCWRRQVTLWFCKVSTTQTWGIIILKWY